MAMTGLQRRRDGQTNRWWFRMRIGGRRYSRTFTARTEREAERLARAAVLEIEAEAARARSGVATDVRMSRLLDDFERDYAGTRKYITDGTRRSNRDSLVYFRKFFVDEQRDPRVAAVTKGHVQRYFDWRRPRRGRGSTRTVSQRTLRRDYAVLHLVFGFAVEREWRESNPVDQVRKPPMGDTREAMILTEEQAEALLRACDGRPMLYLFVLLCYETGLRPNSEALWLRWEDVDFKRAKVRVVSGRDGHTTKGRKSRTLPVSTPLLEALRKHSARYQLPGGSPWVFHHVSADRRAAAGHRLKDLRRAFRVAAKVAKLPAGVWAYDLRHTRITRWVAAGHNLALVQKAAGHASMRTTMIYVHLVDDDLSVLVDHPARARVLDLRKRSTAS